MAKNMLAFVAAVSLMTSPVLAQTGNQEYNGHHYQGGPKTEVPHHMGKKDADTVGQKRSTSGTHHYTGGPANNVPHHTGERSQ